jgi:hypothetical protein
MSSVRWISRRLWNRKPRGTDNIDVTAFGKVTNYYYKGTGQLRLAAGHPPDGSGFSPAISPMDTRICQSAGSSKFQ